eukprot:CAMPEP_0116095088 /NCGR_PEP_ID=MMETSP0327-20121206/9477_1 /TAXON_ID=44447 /ORGANISM="Pseudo-nitzschia delicatissima, Strain B596" /LENGTH=369 /DNA_ID=CAMNT_0003586733 /DNA_START=343 /DNA_END=1452 /DNA_ORIENTATION=-
MTNFKAAAASLLLLSNVVTAQDGTCADIGDLGIPNLDRYDYSISMDVDDDCEFSLEIAFTHNEDNPLPSDPMTQCDPSIVPPALAADGAPYFAFRWNYQTVPDDIKQVTGVDHISIDWNPCGHPPLDAFAAPHYDLHIYLESPEYRTCMTCTPFPGAPFCDPTPGAQTTEGGLAFFNVATVGTEVSVQRSFNASEPLRNMPADFQVGMADMIPLMGGHTWNPNQLPPSSLEWAKPIWIMGPYDGGLIDYEPMIPFSFMTGEDKEFTEALDYVGQTIDELPTSYTVKYDATSGVTTVVLKGSAVDGSCENKMDHSDHDDAMMMMDDAIEMDGDDAIEMDGDDAISGSVATAALLSFASTASIVMASFLLF